MHRILVPVDGSECALRAVAHAGTVAKLIRDASIHLLHVHEEPVLYGELAIYATQEKVESLQRKHGEAILADAAKLLDEKGVLHTGDAVVGPIAGTIAQRAKDLDCSSIIMGTRGMTSIGNLLMGSIATKVVHLADLPVTLVK